MATYSDSFAYGGVDGTLSSVSSTAWVSVDGTLYYDSATGSVRPNVPSSFNCGYYNSTLGNDQYASLKIVGGTAANTTSFAGPAVRMNTSSGACYVACYNRNGASSRIRIGYYAGSGISAASSWVTIGQELATTDVLKLEVSGSNLTCKINDSTTYNSVSLPTYTDSTLTSGYSGILINNANTPAVTDYYVDDWTGGDLSGGSVAPIVAYYSNFGD